jgi:hypothetical protein
MDQNEYRVKISTWNLQQRHYLCVTTVAVLDWKMDLLTTYTRLVHTFNYNAIANLHTLQITWASAKPFSSLLGLHQPFPDNGF